MIDTNVPAGSSLKAAIHYSQLIGNPRFCQFDYGIQSNFVIYNQSTPPEYKLNHCTARVAIIYSEQDALISARDILRLPEKLSNFVAIHRVDDKTFNHYDFTWAADAKELAYDFIIDWMKAEDKGDMAVQNGAES